MTRRKTPIEHFIDGTVDRRAKYEKAQRDAGFIKTSMWVPADCIADVRQLVKLLGATNGNYRKALKELCTREFGK